MYQRWYCSVKRSETVLIPFQNTARQANHRTRKAPPRPLRSDSRSGLRSGPRPPEPDRLDAAARSATGGRLCCLTSMFNGGGQSGRGRRSPRLLTASASAMNLEHLGPLHTQLTGPSFSPLPSSVPNERASLVFHSQPPPRTALGTPLSATRSRWHDPGLELWFRAAPGGPLAKQAEPKSGGRGC